jgi:hypothetical protein
MRVLLSEEATPRGVAVPITRNPSTQGTRLFLNSLFEADCVVAETR